MEGGKIFSGFNAAAFKEPRGFIKPIQWILSIFAFATTTSVKLNLSFQIKCINDQNGTDVSPEYKMSAGYPFALEDQSASGMALCNQSFKQSLLEGSSSPAQFYVFVGVMVFLYCMAALVLYIFCDDFYRKHNACTVGDFIASCVIVVFWLISASAWAQGVTNLKFYTDLEECGYFNHIALCGGTTQCFQIQTPNFAELNVSIIFGFLNMLVWGGNLWFLYKETPWHKVQSKPPTLPGQPAGEVDPQRI